MAARVRRSKRAGLRMLAVLVICICGMAGYQRMKLEAVQDKKNAEIERLRLEIEEEEERTKALEQQKAYSQTKLFVEEVARQYLGLVYPDEIIIKPKK